MTVQQAAGSAPSVVDDYLPLREPWIAGGLALLVPGLGHWYQGRRAKAVVFFFCIVSSFCYGLYLGDGRVVYASWNPSERRLPFLCQAFVGLPAVPAIVQANRFGEYNLLPAIDGVRPRIVKAVQQRMRQQINPVEIRDADQVATWADRLARNEGEFWDWFMVPPVLKHGDEGDTPDELDQLHKNLNRFFELGTVYTMIAGLLNVLVIYDAIAGPAFGYRLPKRQE